MIFGNEQDQELNGSGHGSASSISGTAIPSIGQSSCAATASESAQLPGEKPKRTLALSRDQLAKISEQQRNHRAAAIGKMVGLLARAAKYRTMRMKDLEWFLMPAVALGQYMIAETKPSTERHGTGVVAMLLWARLSPEADKRLKQTKARPVKLQAHEWRSGDIIRTIEVIGRKDSLGPLLAEFNRKVRRPQGARTKNSPSPTY